MKTQITAAALCSLISVLGPLFAQEAVSPGTSVRESIRDSFDRSFVGVANNYDMSDVPELVAMLDSEDESEYWPRVVGVLGVVGDAAVANKLIEVIEEPSVGPVYISQVRHDTRAEAIKALGYLIAGTGSERTLNYLTESLDDTIWRRTSVRQISMSFC
jgi:hypothetical protein